jgi:cob(I)alamin adenosyltransferase
MGEIYVYTGEGAGKTTNALGLALRCIGHRKKVIIIQFLKWWKNIGEYRARKKLKPYYEIYQFGRPAWLNISKLKKKVVKINGIKYKIESLTDLDRQLCERGLEFAEEIAKKKKPHLLVLDEINLAAHLKLINVKNILKFLKKLPKKTHVVLTGRYAPKELIEIADFVNEITVVKMPKRMISVEGIQY